MLSRVVNTQLNTLLTTLYVFLTDQVLPDLGVSRVRRAGRKPVLTDAELLCLVVAQQLLAMHSETRWIRYAHTHLRPMFPGIPGQSGYNKRVRATGPPIAAVITALADRSSSGTIYARVAARLLALAAGIWHKWHTGAPRKRSLIAYDH